MLMVVASTFASLRNHDIHRINAKGIVSSFFKNECHMPHDRGVAVGEVGFRGLEPLMFLLFLTVTVIN
jgi:hypothetical protein